MFGKVEELLKSEAISTEVAEALDAEISTALGALRDEAKTYRQEKETLSKSYDEIIKSKDGLDEQLKNIDERIATAKEEGKGELVKQLEGERKAKDELQKNLENLQSANTRLTLDNAVATELNNYDVKTEDREIVQFYLRSKADVSDSGVIFKDGDNAQPLSEAFKTYFEQNGSRLNARGEGQGSGARDGKTGGSQNVKTREEFEKMPQGQKASFMANGGQLQ